MHDDERLTSQAGENVKSHFVRGSLQWGQTQHLRHPSERGIASSTLASKWTAVLLADPLYE